MNIPVARAAVNPSSTTMRSAGGARVSIAGRGVAALRSVFDVTTRRMTSRVVMPAATARPLEPARAISPASEDQFLGTDRDKATYENTGQLQVRFFSSEYRRDASTYPRRVVVEGYIGIYVWVGDN